VREAARAVRAHGAEFGLASRPASRPAGEKPPASRPTRRPRATSDSRPTPPPLPLSAYAGAWRSDEVDAVWTLAAKPRLLTISCRGVPPLDVGPAGPDVFSNLSGMKLTFRRDASGNPIAFAVAMRGVDGIEFLRPAP
jgi:hypothetical protein